MSSITVFESERLNCSNPFQNDTEKSSQSEQSWLYQNQRRMLYSRSKLWPSATLLSNGDARGLW